MKNGKLSRKIYCFILFGLSFAITLLIASEEAEFLMTVFERAALLKSIAIALFNAMVPIAIAGALEPNRRVKLWFLSMPMDLIRFKLPVFILGVIVLSFASYHTVQKYIGEINTKNWAESRIAALDAQIERSVKLLKNLESQPINTAVKVRHIEELEKERNSITINPKRSEIEAWFKVILLTSVRMVLWFLAISMSRRAMEMIREKDQPEHKADDPRENSKLAKENAQYREKLDELSNQMNRMKMELELEEKRNLPEFNSFEIRRRIKELKERGEAIEFKVNGQKRTLNPTYRSVLVNYGLPFIEQMMKENTSKTA